MARLPDPSLGSRRSRSLALLARLQRARLAAYAEAETAGGLGLVKGSPAWSALVRAEAALTEHDRAFVEKRPQPEWVTATPEEPGA